MNSKKFMLIALILLAMIPGANPDVIFTGAATVGISALYPGLQEAFRNYATQIASNQASEGQQLEVEVAAYNALTQPGAVVSYFQGLDDSLRQEIFEGTTPTVDEVSAVWEMINTWSSNIYGAGQTLRGLVSNNPLQVLQSLSEFAMIASCLRITYSAVRFTCDIVRGACSIASGCGRVTIGALKGLAGWFRSSPEASANIATVATAAASGNDEMRMRVLELLGQIAELPDSYNDMTIEELNNQDIEIEGSMSAEEYETKVQSVIDAINALKILGLSVTGMNRSVSVIDRPALTEQLPQMRLLRRAQTASSYFDNQPVNEPDNQTNISETTIGEPTIGKKRRRGGRTKKHLKRKKTQRKSVRKQRKTKRKRIRTQKSRRYRK